MMQEEVKNEEPVYYENDSYNDGFDNGSKKFIIIGAIVVGIILILLLFLIFGGKSKKNVDSNNKLKDIFVEGGTLEPAFNKDVLEYDLKTTSNSIRIICKAESQNAKVTGCDLGEQVVADIKEDIVITVTAADKKVKKYTLRVNPSNSSFKVVVTGDVPSAEATDKDVNLTGTIDPADASASYTYQWYKDSKAIEGATNTTYVAKEAGTYVLEAISAEQEHVKSNEYIVKNINSEKPIIESVEGLPSGWTDTDITIVVKAKAVNGLHATPYSFDNGVTWQESATMSYSEHKRLKILVRDVNSYVSNLKEVEIKIDKNKPSSVKISGSVASGTKTSSNVSLTAVADPATTPSGYRYQWYKDGSAISGANKSKYTASKSGNYTVKVTNGVNKEATSKSYNVNKTTSSYSANVYVNKVTGNATKWTKSNVTLKVTGGAAAGMHSLPYSFDNGRSWQASNAKTFSSNQTVYIKVRDRNGSTSATKTVTINKIDKSGPVVTFSPNGSNANGATADVKVSVSDKGVKSLGTLYFALSKSDKTTPTFSSTFKSGSTIRIANGSGTYYVWVKALDSLGNTTITKSKGFKINGSTAPNVVIKSYKSQNEKKVGNVLKTVTNANLKYTNWAAQQYMFEVTATSSNAKIKSIKWELTQGGKKTEAEANKAWISPGTTYNYNSKSATKYLGIYADGVRLGRITVTDTNGKTRVVYVRANVDMSAPTVKFSMSGTKSGSSYKSGAKLTATCTDNLSGLVYMNTIDTQYSSDSLMFNQKSPVTSKSQTISLVSTGSKRTITARCKDALGNATTKVSSAYSIVK